MNVPDRRILGRLRKVVDAWSFGASLDVGPWRLDVVFRAASSHLGEWHRTGFLTRMRAANRNMKGVLARITETAFLRQPSRDT